MVKYRYIVVTFILVGFFFLSETGKDVSFTLHAQTAEQLKGDLDELSQKIKALDDEIKAYNKKISETQGEAKTLKQALAQLETRRTALNKDIDYTKLRIQKAEENISFTEEKIESTEDTLNRTKAALSESFRALKHNEESVPRFVRLLAPNAKLSDVVDITKREMDVNKAITEKADALSDTKDVLAVQKASYESHKKNLLSLNQTLSNQRQLVDQTSKDKNSLLEKTKNQETAYQKLLADRKKKKNDLEAEMLDVEAKLKTVVDVSKLPKYGKGVLRYPVEKVVITQYFGNTPFSSKNPQVYNGSGHNGLDFGVRVGTPILSAASGVVVGSGDTDASCNGVSYGKWVLVKHQNGLSTLYAHLSVIGVKTGQEVKEREQLGLSGNTGYSTGPHLHFTVYASDAVQVQSYRSKVCGTNMTMPVAPRAGYLNPLSYL
jgi:murein DD-endopeptidase MepM/ murein hydrolase activator NlpD